MRIYLVAGHSCGKTTLCRYISEKYSLPMITEVARTILAEMEIPLERLRTDIDLVNKYQRMIFERQIEAERRYDRFISDRAFDNIAYAAEHSLITSEVFHSPLFQEYINWVRQGIVIFLRPHRALLKEDGTRETPTWESVLRIDGMIKFMLECNDIKYLPVESISMQERVRTIEFLMKNIAAPS